MLDFVNLINGYVWSPALVYLCLGVGVYFSIRTRFMQVRHLREMVRLMFDGKASDEGVSSFQALTMTLSGRVGIGNIAGVATAIAFGGPGAVFWMWMMAFLGASTSYVECCLGQIYKTRVDGQYRGGPAYYIERGLGMRWYAIAFALATILGCGLLLPGMQANGIASGMQNAFGIPPATTALGIVIALGLIIFGGVKRIARFAEIIVPFMALGYILMACVVIALHIRDLPEVLRLIVSSALSFDAGFGAMIGLAIQWGVKRGVYSNEAGQGTGPHAAAAAEVSHPAKQGIVQAFAVYVDTLFVCSATAFMVLITGKYNVANPAGGFLFNGLPGVEAGTGFTQSAVESMFPGFGAMFVGIALLFFAFTTIVAYYYIAETNVAYILRNHRFNDTAMFLLKVMLLATAVYGAVRSSDLAWGLGDIGVGLMAWLNIIAILMLQKPALKALDDYEAQQAKGIEPEFDPRPLGIKHADYWETRADNLVDEGDPRK
ncbi:alanine/glycine:cation symporter family protein [Chitinilyticum piscinae]|uniref:Alanine:cation symporter family protein n=1 Tax=Chitinilyticum piscinae TaxID=2866724 RepID=A0A8J7FL19_9NEIS|nr:alanine/glycine:cation symporter family protein [Chitinilyticum piscinae]MBE9608161.1 alanine:cation symporter family protein [Chitinilyticum piscinae]